MRVESMNQSGFTFDAPLLHTPASQIPPKSPRCDDAEMIERLRAILPDLPDDIELDAPLRALGLEPHSLTHWHRARALDALIGGPFPEFQAYRADEGKLRYRRLPPLMPCPGYGNTQCGKPTRGGKRCAECLGIESEDLWNQE